MKKDVSPEERLLGLIKNKNKNVALPQKGLPEADGKTQDLGARDETRRTIHKIFNADIFKNKLFEGATLKYINRYLITVLVILGLYLIVEVSFIRPYRSLRLIASRELPSEAGVSQPKTKEGPAAKDYSSYSSDIAGRNIFGPSSGGGGRDNITVSDNISERLGLVGVIAGENPQAIIEDKKSQKTYYLGKGQSFDGYTIEEISDGKVTLDCEGRKIALFL